MSLKSITKCQNANSRLYCGVADKRFKDFRLLKSAMTTDSYSNEVRKFLSPTVVDSSVKPGNLLIRGRFSFY